MNAKQLALTMKMQDERDRQIENERAKEHNSVVQKYTAWITEEFESFKPEFTVVKKWLAGYDYWLLVSGCKAHCSCVIIGHDIHTQCGEWSGTHSSRSYSNKREDLRRHIALVMKDQM